MREEERGLLLQRGNGQFAQIAGGPRRTLSGRLQARPRREVLRAVAESLGAMANGGGGTVFLGAEPGGAAQAGLAGERERRAFRKLLEEAFHPPLPFRVSEEEVSGDTVLSFTVQPSPSIHAQKDGRVFLRVGALNLPLSRDRVAALREARAETWQEREVLACSSLEDLDPDLIGGFLARAGLAGEGEKILHRPYGLIEYREGRPVLTRAAAYLFGRDPLRWHSRPGIEFVRFEGPEAKGGEGYNVAERIRLEAPLLRLIPEAEKEIGGKIRERVLQRDLFFRETFDYPDFSWKEALINALAHRDYSLEGSAVSVAMFDDRIEVRSPGRLPGGIRPEQILGRRRVHYSRNPLITRVLADAGHMGALGEGLPRVFQEMERNGLNPPEWGEEGIFFRLVFRNTPVLDGAVLAWLRQFDGFALSPRQKRILAYARVHGGIFSSSDYQKFGVGRDGAYGEIKDLVGKGIVEPLKKHGKAYRVREAEEGFLPLPGMAWAMELLKEKEHFELREVKVPKTLSLRNVRAILRELGDQGYLTSSGKGLATRYRGTEKLKGFLERRGGERPGAGSTAPGEG